MNFFKKKASKNEEYTEQKGNYKSKNFREFFFSTVEKEFENEYTRCLNYNDTLTVLCDSYILMFQTMDSLSRAPSVEWWIRKSRNIAYKSCLRRKALSIAHENSETDEFPNISSDDKFRLWSDIKRIGRVNAFLLMPVPYSAVGLKGVISNTVQGFSPKKKLTIVSILCSVIILAVGVFSINKYVLPAFAEKDKNIYLGDYEIFLGNNKYDGFEFSSVKYHVDDTTINTLMEKAAARAEEKIKEDEEEAARIAALEEQLREERKANASSSTPKKVIKHDYSFIERKASDYVARTTTTPFTYNEVEVNAEGSLGTAANIARYSGDEWLDKEVNNVVTQLVHPELNDTDRLGALYSYVCKYGRYGRPTEQFDTYIERAKYFYKYRTGTSAEYAAAFYALCSAAGYDCQIVEGYFTLDNSNGTKTYYTHEWVRIVLNGIEYHFDPEADSNSGGTNVRNFYFMAAKGNSRWKLFCRDHEWAGKSK